MGCGLISEVALPAKVAFVTFKTSAAGEKALEFNGDDYKGNTLKVNLAHDKKGDDKGGKKGKGGKGKDDKGKGKNGKDGKDGKGKKGKSGGEGGKRKSFEDEDD